VEVGDGVYLLPGPTVLGIVRLADSRALMVDAGLDSSAATKAFRALRHLGLALSDLLITHAHADHSGGAPHLASESGATVWASDLEGEWLGFPLWESYGLYGGSVPPRSLRNKFLTPGNIRPQRTLKKGICEIEGDRVEVLALPGHSLGQVGFRVRGVTFLAGSLLAGAALRKHPIPFIVDVESHVATLRRLCQSGGGAWVASHGGLLEDGPAIARENLAKAMEVEGS